MEKNNKYNLSHKGLETERLCDPSTIVIFGASGNLTQIKLMPALFNLFIKGDIPKGSCILGIARSNNSDYDFKGAMKKALAEHDEKSFNEENWEKFSALLNYINADFESESCYKELKEHLEKLEEDTDCSNRLFYLAVPPQLFGPIADNLKKTGLHKPVNDDSWTRIIFEKPFGDSLRSAKDLNNKIGRIFKEQQIYRIDHYLGKETVQNLLVFRFGNSIFEPIWNRNYIDHVQITAAETLGIGTRAGYYDKAGALRDMIPNHLFQLLSLIAMEPPVTFEADTVRDEKVQVLQAIQPIGENEIDNFSVRGQYSEGEIESEKVLGYKQEQGIPRNSNTETFAALKFYIQNWRWAGVPFYLRTGKRMPKFVTDITLVFRKTPHMIFRMIAKDVPDSNILSIRIQPDESIELSFNAKVPGAGMKVKPVVMDFDYFSAFGVSKLSNAYELLIHDCLSGDQTLYSRRDAVEASWAIVDNIINGWKNSKEDISLYKSGTWGPKEADELLAKDGRKWREL